MPSPEERLYLNCRETFILSLKQFPSADTGEDSKMVANDELRLLQISLPKLSDKNLSFFFLSLLAEASGNRGFAA